MADENNKGSKKKVLPYRKHCRLKSDAAFTKNIVIMPLDIQYFFIERICPCLWTKQTLDKIGYAKQDKV